LAIGPGTRLGVYEIQTLLHWLAYQGTPVGAGEIYVQPFPNVDGGRWQISTGGGAKPVWSRKGRELFYLGFTGNGWALTSVTFETTPTFSADAPKRILQTQYFNNYAGRTYDVAPDGQKFLMTKERSIAEPTSTTIVVMLDWLDSVRAVGPAK